MKHGHLPIENLVSFDGAFFKAVFVLLGFSQIIPEVVFLIIADYERLFDFTV